MRIAATDIVIEGDAKSDPEFVKLETQVPKTNTILNHETYDNYKNKLQQLALTRGYFRCGIYQFTITSHAFHLSSMVETQF